MLQRWNARRTLSDYLNGSSIGKMSPTQGFLLFMAGFPLACLAGLLGMLGAILVIKLNGPPKLAFALIIVPLGVVFLIQLFALFISSAPHSLIDIIQWIVIVVIFLLVLAPGIYVNRKLSQKFSLSRDESIKAIISFFTSGLIFGVVSGLMLIFNSDEWSPEGFDLIFAFIIMPLSSAVFLTFLGWLIIRHFSKSPSRIAYILPDWLLRLFDPFYIPPYGKKQRGKKLRKT